MPMGCLMGAALAVWLYHRGPAWGSPVALGRAGGAIAAALGLLGLLGAAPLTPGYGWGVTALAALATGGVIRGILAGGSCVTRCLESGWLVRIGWVSYGVYLWHFPVFFQLGVLWGPGESAAPLWRVSPRMGDSPSPSRACPTCSSSARSSRTRLG